MAERLGSDSHTICSAYEGKMVKEGFDAQQKDVTYASISLFPDELVLKGSTCGNADRHGPRRVRSRRQCNLARDISITNTSGWKPPGHVQLTAFAVFQLPSCDMLPTMKMFCE